MRQLKRYFLVPGSFLSLPWIVGFRHYFGDLSFSKMAATHPFLRFFSIKESYEQLIPAWYTFHRKSFTNSNKLSFWISKLLESDSFDLYIENILTKFVTTYWLVLTLDPCPCEMNKYFLLKLHHVLFTLHPNKKREF